jgi:hypothetical protein
VQGRRDREWRQRPIEHVAIHLLAQQAPLQHALGQFLDKQRHAVGAIDDLGEDFIGQCLVAGDLLDQNGPVIPVEAIERHHADLRLAGPRHLELGAESHDQQHSRLRTRSTVRSSSSREVGSIQWASSKIMTTG